MTEKELKDLTALLRKLYVKAVKGEQNFGYDKSIEIVLEYVKKLV